MARFFIAGLITCLLINFISAVEEEPQTWVYRGKAQKTLSLKPCSWKQATVKVEGDIYARRVKHEKNSISMTIRNPSIIVETDDHEQLNLGKCESGLSPEIAITKPFLITYSEEGKLESVAVNKNEPELSKNIKLFLATVAQLDNAQIHGHAEHLTERMEPSHAGMCPAVFKLMGHEKDGTVSVQKNVDYGKCKAVAEDWTSDGLTCLEKTCRSSHKKNVKWTGGVDITVKEVDGENILKSLSFEEKISYNPHKHSEVSALATTSIDIELKDIRKCPEVPSFEPSHETELINGPVRRNVNKHICESPKSKWQNILKESYSALVCEQPYAFLFEDVVERSILCDLHV